LRSSKPAHGAAKDFAKGVRNDVASDVAKGKVGMAISGMAMFPFLFDVFCVFVMLCA
jgi:hypothetical protein